ncbi:MAG: imidazolonepropionase [Anaerolineae bacterium]|nr:imidazolonepropionase [Anaerolineae bacterium]
MVGGHYGLTRRGAILIDGGTIVWVGKLSALPRAEARETIAGRGRLATPGLIDCHTHIVYGGNRADEFEQRLQGVPYEEIAAQGGGILSTVRATRKSSAAALAAAARPRIRNLIREGVTTLEIKTGYGLNLETEIKMVEAMDMLAEDLPVEISKTFLGAHALPPEYHGRQEAYVSLVCDTMIPQMAGRVDAVDVFCESIGFSVAQTRRIFEVAKRHGLTVKIHAEQLSHMGGAAMAAEMGALSVDHLEYINPSDLAELAATGTVAVLLPGALYYLRESHSPPVEMLRRFQVPVAIATDANPGTSPCFSILTAMNMACVLLGLTPEEALAGVTVHAARALGRQTRIGTLEAGKQADIALWNVDSPAELSYYLGYSSCSLVIKDGQPRSIDA